MSEEQVQEPRVPYMGAGKEAGEERPLERLQVQFPPYFDRFLEERDQRIASELSRLEAAIAHNGAGIARLSTEMESHFAEAKEDREALRQESQADTQSLRQESRADTQSLRQELRTETQSLRQELRTETQTLRAEMRAQFRWTIGLLFPLVAGMLAIIIRVFLVGTF